jgi:hypothetical protein
LTAIFMLLVVTMCLFSRHAIRRAWRANRPTAPEEPHVALRTVAASAARP